MTFIFHSDCTCPSCGFTGANIKIQDSYSNFPNPEGVFKLGIFSHDDCGYSEDLGKFIKRIISEQRVGSYSDNLLKLIYQRELFLSTTQDHYKQLAKAIQKINSLVNGFFYTTVLTVNDIPLDTTCPLCDEVQLQAAEDEMVCSHGHYKVPVKYYLEAKLTALGCEVKSVLGDTESTYEVSQEISFTPIASSFILPIFSTGKAKLTNKKIGNIVYRFHDGERKLVISTGELAGASYLIFVDLIKYHFQGQFKIIIKNESDS